MNKRIIIVGGMGPQASMELHKRILNKAIDNGAINGSDFPEIIHLSLPIDDFISDASKRIKAEVRIKRALRQLYFWRRRQDYYSL